MKPVRRRGMVINRRFSRKSHVVGGVVEVVGAGIPRRRKERNKDPDPLEQKSPWAGSSPSYKTTRMMNRDKRGNDATSAAARGRVKRFAWIRRGRKPVQGRVLACLAGKRSLGSRRPADRKRTTGARAKVKNSLLSCLFVRTVWGRRAGTKAG